MSDLLLPQALVGYRPLKERHVDKGQTLAKFGKQIKHGKLKKVKKRKINR